MNDNTVTESDNTDQSSTPEPEFKEHPNKRDGANHVMEHVILPALKDKLVLCTLAICITFVLSATIVGRSINRNLREITYSIPSRYDIDLSETNKAVTSMKDSLDSIRSDVDSIRSKLVLGY